VSAYVRVRTGGGPLALRVEHVREIARLGAISPVPGAGEVVLGVRNLRGQVLPVFDLAALLGRPTGDAARIIVAEADGRRAGLTIEGVTDVADAVDPDEVIDVAALFAAIEERAAP
jgi:purine-binding chemotaxis protein CheW